MKALIAAAAAALALAACAAPAAGPSVRGEGGATLAAAFDCARDQGAVLVSAHRGGPAPGFPENAIETLARSRAAGVALLEVDVRQAAGSALVLMHDDTLERTTTGEGPVAGASLEALSALRLEDASGAQTAFAPPTLRAALAWAEANGAILQLDVKRGAPLAAVIGEVRAAGAEERAILIVYNAADAAEIARLAPDLKISATINDMSDLAALERAGVDPRRVLAWTGNREPKPQLWRALRNRGIEPIFGTLGGAGSLDRQIAADGDDARYADIADDGLSVLGTDRPIEARAALEAAGIGPSRANACFAAVLGP